MPPTISNYEVCHVDIEHRSDPFEPAEGRRLPARHHLPEVRPGNCRAVGQMGHRDLPLLCPVADLPGDASMQFVQGLASDADATDSPSLRSPL